MHSTRERMIMVMLLAVLSGAAAGLTACGSKDDISGNPNVRANEAPPAAPFIPNVQNLSEDNNYMKYKEFRGREAEHEGHYSAAGVKPIMSERLAAAVMALPGVAKADVLIAGDQAFVAVTPRALAGEGGAAPGGASDAPGMFPRLNDAITQKVLDTDVGIRQVFITDQTEYMRRFEAIREEKGKNRPIDALKLELFEAFNRIVPGHVGGNNPIPPAAP